MKQTPDLLRKSETKQFCRPRRWQSYCVKSRYETITMQTRIRENIALAESAGSGQSIFEYDPQSNGAKDYQALTEEIISRNQ